MVHESSQGATVTISINANPTGGAAVTDQAQTPGSNRHGMANTTDLDAPAAKGGVSVMADGGVQAKRVETLEEVWATLRMMSRAVDAMQMLVANQLEQERAGAEDFPLNIYEELVATGALDDMVAGLDEEEDREEERDDEDYRSDAERRYDEECERDRRREEQFAEEREYANRVRG